MSNIVIDILWINVSVFLLLISISLSLKSKFIQFRIHKLINALFKQNKLPGITNVQSLMITLGGKIGVGSISGIALAIYYGGPGTIFWIIIISSIISILTFYEVILANKYKEIDEANIYKGGPSYYIKKGLKKKFLSIIYAILVVICYNGCFLSIQANTLMKMTNNLININAYWIGIFICLLSFFMIYKGIREIAKFSNLLVPMMLFLYIILAIYVLITNYGILLDIIVKIISSAFNFKSFVYGFIPMIILSIQRSIFATESGIGTTAIASSTTNSDPITQGFIQVLGVYITTFIVGLSTAILIFTTDYGTLVVNNINGIELVIYAFNYHFGSFGNIILYIIVLLFCFSTIITGYYNGEVCIKSLNIKKTGFLKLITLIVLFIGSIVQANILWKVADLLIGIMLIINMYAIYKLRNEVKEYGYDK